MCYTAATAGCTPTAIHNPLLPSLYLVLTFQDWKSQIFSLSQLSLQLRVAVRPTFGTWGNVCWRFWKTPFSSKKRRKAGSTASFLWTPLHEDVMSRSVAAILQKWSQRLKYRTREEKSGTSETREPTSEQPASRLFRSDDNKSPYCLNHH